jgi:hypothetical protein
MLEGSLPGLPVRRDFPRVEDAPPAVMLRRVSGLPEMLQVEAAEWAMDFRGEVAPQFFQD